MRPHSLPHPPSASLLSPGPLLWLTCFIKCLATLDLDVGALVPTFALHTLPVDSMASREVV